VTDRQQQLLPLLDRLATNGPTISSHWQEWQIEPVTGGRNNLLYHVRSEHGDYAVKFTMRDDRDRAGSEYRALLALQWAGLDVAPRPVLLEQTRYRQPVVVQTWIKGEKVGVVPSSDADWRALLRYYRVVHGVSPESTDVSLEAAVLTMDSATSGRARLAREIAHVPPSEQPTELRRLIETVERNRFPSWPPPPVTLCRCDSNPENFIRRPWSWASVDWEYSGWGDPAFELAELRCHPAYLGAPSPPLELLVALYDPPVGDQTFAVRAQVYYRLMLVWWAVRLARMLYEVDRGFDERLAPRSATWRAETEGNYNTYLMRAMAEFGRGRSRETGVRNQNRHSSPSIF
jgi:aminoglycoside phosphotransferase (APT) family kinase protein